MSAKDLYFLGGVSSESFSREELLFSDAGDDEFDTLSVVVEALGDALELTLVSSFGETSTIFHQAFDEFEDVSKHKQHNQRFVNDLQMVSFHAMLHKKFDS
ncbi:uncharacterized protein LOC111465736 [Cucurbita maxima]|uniref:Uncharacterized protein LOC111465736 n=1 Tax=Cucurbita maxima TaxID=3661 RepID=A0A6J1HQF8_CUCMA|nr:uncharacterized protein LOC111465736 [Cucurbita maxima]